MSFMLFMVYFSSFIYLYKYGHKHEVPIAN